MQEKANSDDERFLLDKIYDKYKMEISRKDRLEGKTIGYYSITGIFFAAFLVIEPIIFDKAKDVYISLLAINCVICAIYLAIFITSVIKLHRNYEIKYREEFDPIGNWDELLNGNGNFVLSIKNALVNIIKGYNENNDLLCKRLRQVNMLCMINCIVVILSFILMIILNFYKE